MLENSLFWKFKTSEADHFSYIFGTIHLYRDSYSDIFSIAESIIERVDKVYTEASLDSHPDRQQYLISGEDDLKSLMGTNKYEKLKKILFKSIRVNLDQYQKMLPLVVTQHITMMAMGVSHHPPLDALIYQSALRMKKEYDGIETISEQLEIMQKISLDYQLKGLIKLGQNISNFRKRLKHMLDLYEDQDIISLFRTSKKEMGELRKLLLYDRNKIISKRIFDLHKEKPSLFTFGAGHLAGDKGVLALLKRSGADVRAFKGQ